MKIFGFVEKVFFIGLKTLSSFTNANSLSCVSMNNQESKTRPQVVYVHGDEPVFFPFSTETSKCSDSCNNINYLYAKICVPDVVKNLNVKVFNLMSRANETRFIELHETCKCACKFGANYECECDKACDVGEYSDYENCTCRKTLVDKLVDECTETDEEVKLAKIALAENKNSYKCSFCAVYTMLFWIFFTIKVGRIGAYFAYFHGYLKKMFTRETTI